MSPSCQRTGADHLASIFRQIFKRSLELCDVPSPLKSSTTFPVPKKPLIPGLNDYRPVALMTVVIKSFETLVLNHLKDITGLLLDALLFASPFASSKTSTPQGHKMSP